MSTPDPNEHTVPELLADHVRHATVFCEATLRALNDALELIDEKKNDDDA